MTYGGGGGGWGTSRFQKSVNSSKTDDFEQKG